MFTKISSSFSSLIRQLFNLDKGQILSGEYTKFYQGMLISLGKKHLPDL